MQCGNGISITGVGLATSLGCSFDALAANLLAGRSGIGRMTRFDNSRHTSRIAACIDPIPCPVNWNESDFQSRDDLQRLSLWCIINALNDAGLWEQRDSLRVGLAIGLAGEWFPTWEDHRGPSGRRVKQVDRDRDSVGRTCRELLGLRGPSTTVAAACASGNVALGMGRDWIRHGIVDVCVAGAVDCSLTPMGMAGFCNLGALSRQNDFPADASRPFDRQRDGFVMGEGGAMFVLESRERSRRRAARIYGEITGFGGSSDAFHMIAPGENVGPAAEAIRRALADAGASPADLDYVNAHATSTMAGDIFEARTLRAALGEAANRVPVSATKSMTGHLLGASSAVEAAVCLIAIDRNAIPPTINLHEIDPECELNHVAHQAQERPVDVAVSNSFGFGGSNTCLVLRRAA